jgi:hypothetical protein
MLATDHPAICWLAHQQQQQQRQHILGLCHLQQVLLVGAAAQMQQMMLMTGCHCTPSAALEQQQLLPGG